MVATKPPIVPISPPNKQKDGCIKANPELIAIFEVIKAAVIPKPVVL